VSTPEEQEQFLNERRLQRDSDKRRVLGCLFWFIIGLLPVPFSPWWLGVTWMVVVGLLTYWLGRKYRAALFWTQGSSGDSGPGPAR
jgi:hypothetical protein